MTKKKEIELPELTELQASYMKSATIVQSALEFGTYKTVDLSLNKFLEAWINGYTIKKEPKYYIHLLKDNPFGYLNVDKHSNEESVFDNEEDHKYQTKFTKEEINKRDPRRWEFRELVEE